MTLRTRSIAAAACVFWFAACAGGGDTSGGAGAPADTPAAADASTPDATPLDAAGTESGPGGASGSALVSAGVVSKSPNYVLVVTLSQSPGGNGTRKSPSWQVREGVAGATQSP